MLHSADSAYRFLLDAAVAVARLGGSVKRTKTSVVVESSDRKRYVRISSQDDATLTKQLYADVVASRGSELCSESILIAFLLCPPFSCRRQGGR